jgi:DNA-binding CsgD family transcriptional regulator
MGLPVTDLVGELASSTNAHQCLDILAETPRRLGFQIVGFREEIGQPIAPRLPDNSAWERRFGWPNGFVAGWIAEGHGVHFPINQVMRRPGTACQWLLPARPADRGPGEFTSRQRRAVEYMRSFGIRKGLTVPVGLPFGRTGCVTWFASDGEGPSIDGQLIRHLQAAVQRFFDGIDRSRLWIAASPLSPRETECLHWAARGMSDKEIARRIGRSADTVSFHIKAAIRKLDAVNRTHAVALAVRAALIEPTDPQPPFALPDPMG